jgi:acetate kinase
MEKNILVINIGSSSKKYSLYQRGSLLLGGHYERDKSTYAVTYTGEEAREIREEVFVESLTTFYSTLRERGHIHDENPLSAIGIRLVAPGDYFTEDRVVDDTFLEKLSFVAQEDMAHIAPLEKELRKAKELFTHVPVIAVSDSAFHTTMPSVAKYYALPPSLVEDEGVYRFGYHGISLSSIVEALSHRPWGLERKAIICHLGSGASVTAVLDGKSIDTSMGYSPLEGLIMSSRIGTIDVGAVLHVLKKKSVQELQEILYTKSGLLALSGLSDDMRVLIDAEKEGHEGAHRAIEAFAYAIQKHIGMYMAVLGGVDVIVFSGTIGERSFILRDRICQGLSWLNVHLDHEKNTHAKSGDYIGCDGSLGVCVMHSDEDMEIMRKTVAVLEK